MAVPYLLRAIERFGFATTMLVGFVETPSD